MAATVGEVTTETYNNDLHVYHSGGNNNPPCIGNRPSYNGGGGGGGSGYGK